MKKKRILPSVEYLKECFELDINLASGLRRKMRPLSHFQDRKTAILFNAKHAGKMAGSINEKKYWVVLINSVKFHVQRVIYSMYHNIELTGDEEIDHIDRNTLNNHPDNLRSVNRSQNIFNAKVKTNNKSGWVGVSWDKRGFWVSKIKTSEQPRKHIGCYIKFEDAVIARYKAVKSCGFEITGPQHDPNNPEAVRIFKKIKAMEAAGEL